MTPALALGPVLLFWSLALLGALKTRRDNPWKLGPDGPGPEAEQPRVAVIIPARDEAHNIEACARSVLDQDWPHLTLTLFDDGSTDGTTAIVDRLAAAHPGRVVALHGDGGALPEGWLGKPWACHRAAEAALADGPDYLLFLDADVRLTAPQTVRAALGYAGRNRLGLLSGLGFLEVVTFWEKVLQPVIAGLVIAGQSMDKNNDVDRRKGKPLANGQFLLFSREAYTAIGGHKAVANAIVDDVGLATVIRDQGLRYNLLFMRTLFRCRMYNSFGEIWRGWTKNLFIGIDRRWGLLVGITTFIAATSVWPLLAVILWGLGVLGPAWGPWALGTLATLHVFRFTMDRIFDNDPRYGFTHSLGNVLAIALFFNSALATARGRAVWKGRSLGA